MYGLNYVWIYKSIKLNSKYKFLDLGLKSVYPWQVHNVKVFNSAEGAQHTVLCKHHKYKNVYKIKQKLI